MKRVTVSRCVVLGVLWTVVIATAALAAYSAHQNDQDVNNFLAVYPFARSTKLDDSALCHKSGNIGSKFFLSMLQIRKQTLQAFSTMSWDPIPMEPITGDWIS